MSSTEAKKGFLTFLATVTFSVGVFFATYIGITTLNDKSEIGKTLNQVQGDKAQVQGDNTASKNEKQGSVFASLVNSDSVTITQGKVPVDEKIATSAKGELAMTNQKLQDDNSAPVVLAASTGGQSTSGATPSTGFNDIFYITIMGASLVLFGLYFGTSKARTYAIRKFENDASK